MVNDSQLSGKSALVTGASRSVGIGAAIARGLASMGVNVFTTYYRPFDGADAGQEEAGALLDELKAVGVKAGGLEADLADIAAPEAIFDLAERTVGPVDILVNNAAFYHQSDIYALTPALLDAHYQVNMRGTALLCAEFAKRHDGRRGGRIISLSSGQSIDDPGGTDTGWMTPELIADIKANALHNRVGVPQDATRLILFLASAQAEWITGQVLHSRGGL